MFRSWSLGNFFIFDHSPFDVGRSMFDVHSLNKPPAGPHVSWLDKSSSPESAIICVCLCESVANDRSSLFRVFTVNTNTKAGLFKGLDQFALFKASGFFC